jgi:hypothetical protein
MCCYLEGYSAGRFSWIDIPRCGDAKQTTGDCLGFIVLSLIGLALVFTNNWWAQEEQIPGPVVEVENTVPLLCAGCSRNLMVSL